MTGPAAPPGGQWVMVRGVWRFVPDQPRRREPPKPPEPPKPEPPPAPTAPTTYRKACGTSPGYFMHWRRGEPACDPCLTAHAADVRARSHQTGKHKPRVPAPCGTYAAYRRHRRRGEDCPECREAARVRYHARKR